MAQSDTLDVGPSAWVQLTNANATAVTIQCLQSSVFVLATAGAVAPTATDGAFLLTPGEGLTGDLADLWPGVASATRVYALAQNFPAQVVVSHA